MLLYPSFSIASHGKFSFFFFAAQINLTRSSTFRYWWVLSIITYIPVAYVQYKPETQGLLFIGLILGTLISELLFSGTLSDILMAKIAKRNDGVRIPEARLWLMYPAIVLSAGKLSNKPSSISSQIANISEI